MFPSGEITVKFEGRVGDKVNDALEDDLKIPSAKSMTTTAGYFNQNHITFRRRRSQKVIESKFSPR